MTKEKKKSELKKIVKGCCGKGGPGDYGSQISPYKNSYYKKMKAAQAFARVAKTTGLDN